MRAALAALTLLLTPAAAHAAERPLTGEQIRELARRDAVWCENYRAEKGDCETLTMVSLLPDGSLRETGVMRVSRSPDVKLVIDGRSRIEGNRICSVYDDESVRLGVLMNNRPMPAIAAREIEGVVREAMEEFRGKTLCQSFFRDGERYREEITVDGQRRTDLESVYRVQPDEKGLDVRGPDDEAEKSVA